MAGDWIKMRVWLRKDPRVASMADFLAADRNFIGFLTDPTRHTCANAYEYITSDVTRAITVVALLEIWGVARERGDRVGDDLILKHCDLSTLDDICGTPSMGEALEYVEWAIQEDIQDRKGRPVSSVRFPKFFAENESPEDRYKKQHAEAQARYREKKKAESDISVDVAGDITRDITVTPREEKRREDIDKPRKAATRRASLPDDFAPNETGVRLANDAGLNIARELAGFRDHHISKGSVMADWQAAWRTWVGNAVRFGRSGKPANDDPYGLKGAL